MKLSINKGSNIIEFDVTYSKRKTLAIKIDPSGDVSVAAPKGTSRKAIIDMVSNKADWIIKKLNEIETRNAQVIKREFVAGESFMYLGSDYPLQMTINPELNKLTVRLSDGRFMVDSPVTDADVIKSALEAWYRFMAGQYIKSRIDHYRSVLNVMPNRVTIKEQKTMWGSCSSKNNLNFNWRVMMAPAEVVDYLVVHELCHLIHHNHSKKFWNQVSAILPDYKVRQNWLKKNGARLIL